MGALRTVQLHSTMLMKTPGRTNPGPEQPCIFRHRENIDHNPRVMAIWGHLRFDKFQLYAHRLAGLTDMTHYITCKAYYTNIMCKAYYTNIMCKAYYTNIMCKAYYTNIMCKAYYTNIMCKAYYTNIMCKAYYTNIMCKASPYQGGHITVLQL